MTGLRDLRVGMQLAVGTLSIIPVGPLPSLTVPIARWAMILAPVAAIPLGVGAALAGSAGHLAHLPSLVTAGLVLAFLGWATRAMHWDGLADTADGLAVSWDRERALDIMRRGDAGPVAVGVLGLVLLVDTAALAAVLELPRGPLLAGALVVAARGACALTASRRAGPARTDGLGVAVAGSVPVAGSVVVVGAVGVLVVVAGLISGLSPWLGGLAVVASFAAVLALVRRCCRGFGGVTGDVMGAGIEVAQCVLLVVASAGLRV
ncbi:adenosylcobinamide-GDP ribazoletransferase [Dermatophilaceae bacterium Soc4.6]